MNPSSPGRNDATRRACKERARASVFFADQHLSLAEATFRTPVLLPPGSSERANERFEIETILMTCKCKEFPARTGERENERAKGADRTNTRAAYTNTHTHTRQRTFARRTHTLELMMLTMITTTNANRRTLGIACHEER